MSPLNLSSRESGGKKPTKSSVFMFFIMIKFFRVVCFVVVTSFDIFISQCFTDLLVFLVLTLPFYSRRVIIANNDQ